MSGTESRRRGFGLSLKIFLATTLVVVAVLGAAIVITNAVAAANAERNLDEGLQSTSEVVRQNIAAENALLASGAAAAAQSPTFMANVLEGDRSSVFDQAVTYSEVVGADFSMITDARGVLRGRSDNANAGEDSLGGSPLIGGALETGEQVAGFINQADERLYLAVASPLTVTGVVQAVLISADQVTDSLADAVKKAARGSEVVFYVFDGEDQPVIVASSVPRSPALDSAVTAAVAAAGTATALSRTSATINGVEMVGFNVPLINPGVDRPLAGYLALRSRAEALAGFRRLQRTLLYVGAGGLLLALLASFVVARQIAKPVRALVVATNRVAEGDYSGKVPVGGKDEIGQLAASFQNMLDELKAKQQLVDFLSTSAGSAATQPIYTAGGNVASPTMVRSMAGGTGMLAVGQTFAGRYEVKGMLGMGGMGVVYRAMDKELGEPVAIKTLKGDAVASDNTLLARFKDEIRLARKITHRNVVRTYDIGEVEGLYYITMEFVEGQSLKHLIQSRGHLPVNVALTVGKQLCRALEVAHEQGVIHRDIKPQNLIVEPSGTLKVMDFGIARLASRKDGVTQAGMAIGTPEYMAPEQLMGENVDFRADLYAAGCVLFESLTGRTPFVADNPITLVAKQLEETPPAPSSLNAEVPEPLSRLILRTLSKDPAERPASASILYNELDAIVIRTTNTEALTIS